MSTTMGGSSVEKAAVFEMWLRQFPAFRLHQRRERRGIVEHQLADLAVRSRTPKIIAGAAGPQARPWSRR
jgi:hypothetical protein